MAQSIRKEIPKALILFVTFYSKKENLNLVENQAGIYCEAPCDYLLNQARKLLPIKSVGVVSGPFGSQITKYIEEKMSHLVKTEVFLTENWNEYSNKMKEFGEKYDAILPLAPFGVKHADQSFVNDDQFGALLEEIKKPALGYGRVAGFSRTIEMNIDPKDLGANAAAIAFKAIRGDHVRLEEFTSYALKISDAHIKRLALTVPKELLGFTTL